MTTDPDRPAVPGLEPSDRGGRPPDRSQDPDRYTPETDSGPVFDPDDHPRVVDDGRPLAADPERDPDSFLPPGQGQSLPELIGKESTYEGSRDGYQWVFGLIGVLAFLALVTYLFSNVLTP